MMMLCDYHTHTPLCRHAEGSPQDFVAAALEKGLHHYGISDHAPHWVDDFDDWRMGASQIESYIQWIKEAQCLASSSGLHVYAGLECDWLEGCESWIAQLKKTCHLDYLIGAVHYLGDWDFDNPYHMERWEHVSIDSAWQDYWNAYTQMAQSGLFDILAHPDLIKKFNYYPKSELSSFYLPALDAIEQSGASIEINTAGWHKPCKEAYPSLQFLQLARERNIPLVLSSDAHSPCQLARDFQRAQELATAAGYTGDFVLEKFR